MAAGDEHEVDVLRPDIGSGRGVAILIERVADDAVEVFPMGRGFGLELGAAEHEAVELVVIAQDGKNHFHVGRRLGHGRIVGQARRYDVLLPHLGHGRGEMFFRYVEPLADVGRQHGVYLASAARIGFRHRRVGQHAVEENVALLSHRDLKDGDVRRAGTHVEHHHVGLLVRAQDALALQFVHAFLQRVARGGFRLRHAVDIGSEASFFHGVYHKFGHVAGPFGRVAYAHFHLPVGRELVFLRHKQVVDEAQVLLDVSLGFLFLAHVGRGQAHFEVAHRLAFVAVGNVAFGILAKELAPVLGYID